VRASAEIDMDNARRTADEIGAGSGRAVAVRVDVTDPTSAEAGVNAAVEAFGRVDILVNNVGVVGVLDQPLVFGARNMTAAPTESV
jgi:NAD(P)-dependent dehydrogenase (short-subunit alcohol dehydrogenase family)